MNSPSSMCSWIAAMTQVVSSANASTSNSAARSRNLSIRRTVWCEANRRSPVIVQTFFVINNGHCAAAQNIAGPHEHRYQLICNFPGFLAGCSHSIRRCGIPAHSTSAEAFSISARSIESAAVPMMGTPAL